MEETVKIDREPPGNGYLIGAVTPFFRCSTVPMTLGLLKSGAGFGPTMTLLFASPLVNPVIIALFWIAFGAELTLTAKGMGIGAVIALVIGGAGASLPEMVMLKHMFRWPTLLASLFSVFDIAITTGYLAEALGR